MRVADKESAIVLKDIQLHPSAKPATWFVVDSVTETYQQLKAVGVSFLGKPFEIGSEHSAECGDGFGN